MTSYAAQICLAAVLIALKETRDPILRRSLAHQARGYRAALRGAA